MNERPLPGPVEQMRIGDEPDAPPAGRPEYELAEHLPTGDLYVIRFHDGAPTGLAGPLSDRHVDPSTLKYDDAWLTRQRLSAALSRADGPYEIWEDDPDDHEDA